MNTGDQRLTREELYEKVWSVPTNRLAAELGISDVALAKRCKKLNVPKPSPGYWARLAAGQKPKKKPLPPTPDEVFAQAAQEPIGKSLSIPETTEQLHPLAKELLHTLTRAKPDYKKCQSARETTLPEVSVTKALVERAAKSFHVILSSVEPLGILFRKAQGSYNPGYFKKGHDRLYLKIEEDLVEPDTSHESPRRSHWNWQEDSKVGSGVLSFSILPALYSFREMKRWSESEKAPLGQLLPQVVTGIRMHFVELQKRRAQEAIEREKQRIESERRWREYQEKEAIRLEEERKQKHADLLRAAVQSRTNNLLKAAEWWRIHRTVTEFIQECEQRWRIGQQGSLMREQEVWLAWARRNAETLSPFESGYPDPANDGAFDGAKIPQGGPYPAKRDFPRPPHRGSEYEHGL